MDTISAIVEELSPYATVRLSDRPGKIYLDTLNDQPLQPPAVIVAPAEALTNYIRSSGEAARSWHTDVGPEEGGFRLLLVHIVEEVLSKAQAGTTITIEDDDIVVRGARDTDFSDLDPSGEYEWMAEPPNQS